MIYDFGLRLKQLRKKKNLSQKQAGDCLGIASATISAYERNVKTPSVDVLLQMAVLYNTSLDYIMGLDNRTNIYLDGLNESQQQTIVDIVERLRKEFES
ncbi:MAG: helix-turn-helix transcriptional regulator [Eubacteriales bacterium]|nr:helix-turn-helix transcriptional regulator [Eubacteriales bacterium]